MTPQNTNNNEGKRTWEDVFSSITKYEECYGYQYDCSDVINALKQAEKDGVVCLNPPKAGEIEEILTSNLSFREDIRYSDRNWIVDRIMERICGK
ncbi:MAG: hypothetical protein WC373_00805 [Smithella sp.]|jgi:hypothetical protein